MNAEEIELLEELVRIPSPSGSEEGASAFLVDWFDRRGIPAYIDGVGNACARWGEGPVSLCLLGHVDTVSGWPPVGRRGDILTGRGTVDAKGPLAAFASALHRLSRVQRSPGNRSILFVGAVEEEADGSRGARHLVRGFCGGSPPGMVIIGEPSRWDRITLGYRGGLRGRSAHRAPISHTGGPGPTAAEIAVGAWTGLMDAVEKRNADREGLFWSTSPRLVSVDSRSDGLEGETILSFGARIPPGETVDSTKELIASCLGPTTEFGPGEEPYLAERNSPVVKSLLAAIRSGGGKPRFTLKTGTSDMNIVGPAWKPAIAAYGPGDPLLGHTSGEEISLSEYSRSVDVLERAMVELVNLPAP